MKQLRRSVRRLAGRFTRVAARAVNPKRCRACNRKLLSAASRARGFGVVCAKKFATSVYQENLEAQGQLRLFEKGDI